MDIFSIVQATRLKVHPFRKTYVKFPVFMAFDVNFETNNSHFKVYDILENDFYGEPLKDDTLIEKEFSFESADIDSSEVNSRLNLFSIPNNSPEDPILESLKLLVGTTTQSKKDKEPFSCSIFFDDNDFIKQIDFNSFFRNQPNSLEYSNLEKPMNTSLNFTHSATLIASSISGTEKWEFVNYYNQLKTRIQNLSIQDFHLSIDLINSIFHRKLIKSIESTEYYCDRDTLIEKYSESFTINWAHLELETYKQIISEVRQEINELHEKHLKSYKLI